MTSSIPTSAILAHGGAAGLAIEMSLLLLPIVVFAVLAKWSASKSRAAAEAEPREPEGDG